MFEEEQQKLIEYRKKRTFIIISWVTVKFAIAYGLITYLNFGIYIVIGYLLYTIEKYTELQFINSNEIELQLNIINQRIAELEETSNN